MSDYSFSRVQGMQVKIQEFDSNAQYIPIGKKTDLNGKEINAIPEFRKAPTSGTYVLGSKNGIIQWIETEECD
jgi:hypothetical protein